MDRRHILGLIGFSPLALIAAKIPESNPITGILIKRWKKSREYTLAVLDTMPEDHLEYRPSEEQLSFAQHFMHLGFTNNAFMGILLDANTYPDFDALMEAPFFLERPDAVNLFQPDHLLNRSSAQNKTLVAKYVSDTFDFVLSSLNKVSDMFLPDGENKVKPWYLEGHSNLDLILRSESHTTHHRAQAITYLRMNGISPPGYSRHNTL